MASELDRSVMWGEAGDAKTGGNEQPPSNLTDLARARSTRNDLLAIKKDHKASGGPPASRRYPIKANAAIYLAILWYGLDPPKEWPGTLAGCFQQQLVRLSEAKLCIVAGVRASES